jgi:hypothetical protein
MVKTFSTLRQSSLTLITLVFGTQLYGIVVQCSTVTVHHRDGALKELKERLGQVWSGLGYCFGTENGDGVTVRKSGRIEGSSEGYSKKERKYWYA